MALMLRWRFAVLGVLFVLLGTAYAIVVPPWNAPDEPAHFNYVRDVAERGALPDLRPGDWDATALAELTARRFPPDRPIAALRYESHQPPLYYLLAAPLYRVLGDLPERPRVVALRFWSLLLGLATLWCTCRLVDTLFPTDGLLRLAAPAFVALLPMYLHISASVSNDAMATLVVAATLLVGARGLGPAGTLRPWLLGLLSGLAVLTKTTAYVALPLALLALILTSHRRRARAWLAVLAPPALAFAVWAGRNVAQYGWHDPLGLARHAEVVIGQPLTEHTWRSVWRFAGVTFRSFWGQFGWMGVPIDDRASVLLAAAAALAVLGLIVWVMRAARARKASPWADWRQPVLLAAAVALVFGGMAAYNWTYDQPQGRYLFPALPAWAALWAVGLGEALAPATRPVVFGALLLGLLLVNALALAVWLPAYFA